jgi:hypothetical protein
VSGKGGRRIVKQRERNRIGLQLMDSTARKLPMKTALMVRSNPLYVDLAGSGTIYWRFMSSLLFILDGYD